MTYAPGDRAYFDADSHIMELPDFLKRYADPSLRDEIPEVSYSASLVTDEEVAVIMANGGRHSDEHRAAQLALGDRLIERSKEIQGLGAFDPVDRIRALDLLGFAKQLVFATHSLRMPFDPSSRLDPRLRYGAARAHNRHMAAFCSHDARLMGVACIPLDDPALALAELQWSIDNGLQAAWVAHIAAGGRSPGHVDLEPVWDLMAQSQTPFVLHVGGAPIQPAKAWMDNGRPPTKDWMGGGENVRTKDAAVLHHSVELWLSALVLDGVLERHQGLTGGVIELGAGWVPELLDRLDWVAATWGRADANVSWFERTPSEQITAQVGFTPFVFEPVGKFVERSNPDLYLFSSDYPHTEGGRDPLGRFERALEGQPESVKAKYYTDNFVRLFPKAAPQGHVTARKVG